MEAPVAAFVDRPSATEFHQSACHRDFVDAVLGQRDAHRVADAVAQQRADADGTFDPAVFAVTCFRDS